MKFDLSFFVLIFVILVFFLTMLNSLNQTKKQLVVNCSSMLIFTVFIIIDKIFFHFTALDFLGNYLQPFFIKIDEILKLSANSNWAYRGLTGILLYFLVYIIILIPVKILLPNKYFVDNDSVLFKLKIILIKLIDFASMAFIGSFVFVVLNYYFGLDDGFMTRIFDFYRGILL